MYSTKFLRKILFIARLVAFGCFAILFSDSIYEFSSKITYGDILRYVIYIVVFILFVGVLVCEWMLGRRRKFYEILFSGICLTIICVVFLLMGRC